MKNEISKKVARKLMLACLGLDHHPRKAASKETVLDTIRRLGALQIDTIHVVARSPYLALWSRLGEYDPKWLDELLEEKRIFEYWSHAACWLPIEDYPIYRSFMIDNSRRWKYENENWIDENKKVVDHVLERVRSKGEVRSIDFKRTDGQAGGWWNWKVEKIALERLFNRGDLMVARRHNFHRVYSLREKVMPDWNDEQVPVHTDVQRIQTLKAVNALGVATPAWIADYFYSPVREMPGILNRLAGEGELLELECEDWGRVYISKANFTRLGRLENSSPTMTTLLSPFDPLINNRRRAAAVFGFDYKIECYTPAAKRRYGYFTLPILYRGKLIGRLDPKAHRDKKVFEVKAVYLEPGVALTDRLVDEVARTIQLCATWHRTPEVVVRKSSPHTLKGALKKAILIHR